MTEPIYVWDIDRTIVRSSLERHFTRYLREEVESFSTARAAWQFIRLAAHFPPPALWRVKLGYIRDYSVPEIEFLVDQCFAKYIKQAIYAGSLTAVRKLQVENRMQLLVSGTHHALAERLARHLDLRDFIAAEPEIENNRYTGRLTKPHPHAHYKVKYVQEWLDANGYAWEQVIALGDHGDDQYLLAKAGRAVAVNPDKELKRISTHNNWTIVNDASSPNALISVL